MSPQVTHSPASTPSLAAFNGRATGGTRRRVSPPLLGTGVVVVVLCALAIGSLYSGAASRQLVLAVARPVPIGTPISDADLRDVEVATGPGAATIAASRRSQIVGQRPAVALVPGALLAPAQLRDGAGPEAGQALIALALRPGQFPPEVAPGDTVRVISTGSPAAAAPGGPVPAAGDAGIFADPASPPPSTTLLAAGTVVSLRAVPEAPGTTVVSLRVPEQAAPMMLRAGAAVALIVAGAGS